MAAAAERIRARHACAAGRVQDHVRGPGGSRLLRLEAWKAATRAAFLAVADRNAVLASKADAGLAEATVCRAAAAAERPACLNNIGRIAEAIAAIWSRRKALTRINPTTRGRREVLLR
ncbi:putative succinate dehydrogenase membrane anchor subunit protein [Rosellinia necatrix]|uniref:Putative succinate dehydrogenase membrane anchor subunit protein n=1 Tax=Rosellinia necatrix TaxID=77044 RepID=A0A1S8AAF8_ROSNE|nr:putative succinate dehydrogenase membrane anchor subunit protein [Rosellinia necatrix]